MRSSRQVPNQVLNRVMDTLDRGGLVLCANARSARYLSLAYGENRIANEGHQAWRTPLILDWQAWLQSQWHRLLLTGSESRVLLSSFQEDLLWADIVGPSIQNRLLIAPAEVAPLARSAYGLLGSHDALDALRHGAWENTTQEPELFRIWALEMERRCGRNHWLCMARLAQAVTSAISDRRLPCPPAVLWNGFDRLTPAQLNMKTVLVDCGSDVADLYWHLDADAKVVTASNAAEELEACAQWAAGSIHAEPDQRIAILVPDLTSRRAELDRTLRRVLLPGKSIFDKPSEKLIYEFTLGTPLSHIPVIQAAISFLQWCRGPLPQEAITSLLISGFFSDFHDIAALAAADMAVRRKFSVPDMSMDTALERLHEVGGPASGSWAAANWVRRVRKSRHALDTYSRAGRTGYASQWISIIVNMLEDAGWPGDSSKDTVAFQVLERWNRALEEVATGSFDDRRYDFRDFVSTLQSHLDRIIFAPESHDYPITISGILESAGQQFDAIWLLGMTDDAWPPRTTAHPLLPLRLQQERGMPGASATIDQAFAQVVFERLKASTASLILSYAKEGAAGAQRPNAIIDKLNCQKVPLHTFSRDHADLRETFQQEMSVPWPGGPVSGGQRVLRQQSACPFQAFAATRLGAKEMPSTAPGLSVAERGTILHNVLQKVWKEGGITNSHQLNAVIQSGELSNLVKKHVTEVFRNYEDHAVNVWEREYMQLETFRVCYLVEQWLHLESRRRPFQVQEVEASKVLRLENFELRVRKDRVDQVEEGKILIDYKSGNVNKRMWEGERPDEPQLPLYAVFGEVEGLYDVLFAQVSSKEPKFVSAVLGNHPGIFPEISGEKRVAEIDVDECFRTICEQWEVALRTLAREFQAGLATVTPKNYPHTCNYCDFPALCRVAESKADVIVVEGDEDDD